MNTAHYAGPVPSSLFTIVASEMEKGVVPRVERIVNTHGFGVKCVAARIRTNEVVSSLRVSGRLVWQRIKRQIIQSNLAEAKRWNNIVAERCAANSVAGSLSCQRIVNLYAERQER